MQMADRFSLEVYQAFMVGYVRRINEATLQVAVGGVKIGSAKYSRLAQINLKTSIITFSRYAIENVPERGRRYLVIHELAHVREASHNRSFWRTVERYEPNYRQVGKELELAFRRNVREDRMSQGGVKLANPLSGRLEVPKLLLSPALVALDALAGQAVGETADADGEEFACTDEEFADCDCGIMHGGSELVLTRGLP